MKSGVINFLKPVGMTSSDAVVIVRKATGTKKVGHLGTLDPLASGVLPIAFGKATRLFDLFLKKRKTYIAFFDFSYSTDTLDNDGEIVDRTDNVVTEEDIKKILPKFIGKIKQLPPKYSAKNIDGKRAYDLARQGKEFEVHPSDIEIYDMKLLRKEDNNFVFSIECSAGTYIRSIVRDLGQELGTLGTMTALIRTQSGKFDINSAATKDELLQDVEKYVCSAEKALSDLPCVYFDKEDAFKLKNGVKISTSEKDGLYRSYLDGAFDGVIEIADGTTQKRIVIDD